MNYAEQKRPWGQDWPSEGPEKMVPWAMIPNGEAIYLGGSVLVSFLLLDKYPDEKQHKGSQRQGSAVTSTGCS